MRLHLVCTLHGLPVGFGLAGAKTDGRQVPLDLLVVEPELVAARPEQVLLADKHSYGRQSERLLGELGLRLLRPVRRQGPAAVAPFGSCSASCELAMRAHDRGLGHVGNQCPTSVPAFYVQRNSRRLRQRGRPAIWRRRALRRHPDRAEGGVIR